MSEVDQVKGQDAGKRNSQKLTTRPADLDQADAAVCYWNDKKYSAGGTVCDAHRRYECFSGNWIDNGPC